MTLPNVTPPDLTRAVKAVLGCEANGRDVSLGSSEQTGPQISQQRKRRHIEVDEVDEVDECGTADGKVVSPRTMRALENPEEHDTDRYMQLVSDTLGPNVV